MVAGIFGKRLGIVGGLGAETSCSFCLELNDSIRNISKCQPDIVMVNVPVPLSVEQRMICGELCDDMFDLLAKAVLNLNKAGVDFIVIPCNTVHVFIDGLRRISKVPVVSIIEVCADECVNKGFKRVGLLGSSTTIKQRLHQKELEKRNIEIVLPKNQAVVNRIILSILAGNAGEKEKKALLKAICEMRMAGAEAVILGCTDLDMLVSEKDSVLPLIDTTEVLFGRVIEELK